MAIQQGAFGPVVEKIVNPTPSDDLNAGYGIGTVWVNTATDDVFIAADVAVGAAVWSGPVFEEIYTTHIIQFPALAEDLATGVMGGRPGTPVGESGEHGIFTAIRAKAIAGTVGSGAGATTILIEADDNPAFSSPTVLFTLTLTATTEFDDTVLDNSWAVSDIFVRARCTAVEATAPKDVNVLFYFKERAENF